MNVFDIVSFDCVSVSEGASGGERGSVDKNCGRSVFDVVVDDESGGCSGGGGGGC